MTAKGMKGYIAVRRSSYVKESLDLEDSGAAAEGLRVPTRWVDISDPKLEGFASNHF
jgi:hypothetical protein